MHRLKPLVAASACALAFAAPGAAGALCDVLGTCSAPAGPGLDPDGALHVDTPMQALPAPVAGDPLFGRVNGHLQLGLTERAYDGSPSGFGRAATGAQEAAFVRGIGGTLLRVPVLWAQAEPDAPVAGVHDYSWPRDDLYSASSSRACARSSRSWPRRAGRSAAAPAARRSARSRPGPRTPVTSPRSPRRSRGAIRSPLRSRSGTAQQPPRIGPGPATRRVRRPAGSGLRRDQGAATRDARARRRAGRLRRGPRAADDRNRHAARRLPPGHARRRRGRAHGRPELPPLSAFGRAEPGQRLRPGVRRRGFRPRGRRRHRPGSSSRRSSASPPTRPARAIAAPPSRRSGTSSTRAPTSTPPCSTRTSLRSTTTTTGG